MLYVYFSSFQQIDEEDYGGTWELTKEGFMTSFALFLVGVVMLSPTSPVCVDGPAELCQWPQDFHSNSISMYPIMPQKHLFDTLAC